MANYNKMLYSEVLYDNKKRPFTMSGKIDGYIKHKDSFTVIDFKTTSISEKKNIYLHHSIAKLCFNDAKTEERQFEIRTYQ